MKRIQRTGHKESRYGAVGDGWRCGGDHQGGECEHGPSSKGRCPYAGPPVQERYACQPAKKDGKVVCGRIKNAGGPCVEGPTTAGRCCIVLPPCNPQKTYRRVRMGISGWIITVLLSLVAIFLTGDNGSMRIEPGERTAQHRFKDGCSVCHTQSGESLTSWFETGVDAMLGKSPNIDAAGYSCTQCHSAGPHPFAAHDQSPAALETIYLRLFENDLDAPPAQEQSEIRCHQCHSEHLGENGNAASLSDRQCQSCHAQQHSGFDESHPEFTLFPSVSAQRPLYDHDKHFKRFKKDKYAKDAPANCEACHLQQVGAEVEFPNFERTCSACHLNKGIFDKGGKQVGGNTWLAVPRVDASKVNIGYWPNCKTSALQKVKELPPMMLKMLSTDPETAAAIALLRTQKTKMGKLAKASDEEKRAIETLAWSIKSLLAEMLKDDPSEVLMQRLGAAYPAQADGPPMQTDAKSISDDLIRAAIVSWFPSLATEVASRQGNTPIPGQCASKSEWKSLKQLWGKKAMQNVSGWYMQANSRTLELGYKAQEHKDGLLQAMSDLSLHDPDLAKMLAAKKTTTGCQKCHVANADGTNIVWQQQGLTMSTRFRHQPHLTVGETCESCHQLLEKEAADSGVSSNFQTLEKETCQKCHKSGGTVNHCTDCHKYHLHGVAGLTSTTDFRPQKKPEAEESKPE